MNDANRTQYLQNLVDYYDRQANVYHTSYSGEGRYPSNHHRMNIALTLIGALQPQPEVIVDAGCGDARMVVELQKRGYNCTGFDVSEGLMKIGRRHLEDAGFSEALICSGDIYSIPRADRSSDLLLSLGVLENLDQHQQIFAEFRRVLRPGGRVLFTVENHLFSMFSFNKQTLQFYKRLFDEIGIPSEESAPALHDIGDWLQLGDIQEINRILEDRQIDRTGIDLPIYHRLNIEEEIRALGFRVEELRFFHVHPLPPRFEKQHAPLFRVFAEKLESSEKEWWKAILCNCMLVQAVSV